MPRLVAPIVAVVLLMGALAAPAARGQDQDATPAPADAVHPLVGSWQVAVTVDGHPPLELPNLASFTADGVAIVTAPPLLPELPGSPNRDLFSTGHGAWTATGADSADVTFAFLVVGPGGVLASINTVRGDLTVAPDGATYAGAFTLAITAPDGTSLGSGRGTWQAARISAG